jgi:hypothetical protein
MRLFVKNIVTGDKPLVKKKKRGGTWLFYFRLKTSAIVPSKNISENFLVNSLLSSMGSAFLSFVW